MSKFGERLRKARESKGISLAQAAMETRILQQWLVALEEGAYDRLSSDVVAKGFIRNYAQFLGLPVQEMMELYRRERGTSGSIRIVPTTQLTTERSYVLPSFFGVFFVTMILVGLTYISLSAVGHIGTSQIAEQPVTPAYNNISTAIPMNLSEVTPEVQGNLTDGEENEEGEDTDLQEGETPSDIAITAPESASMDSESRAAGEAAEAGEATEATEAMPAIIRVRPTPTLRPAAGMVLATPTPSPLMNSAPMIVEVTISPQSSGSWLRIHTDGKVAFEDVMRAGETRIFQARQQISIRAGNPTVVHVSVNGMPPETLGTIPGQPANWSWPPM
jgi:cytoskeletal protein RodZ